MKFRQFQRVIELSHWRKINLRAAGALLIFLLGWSALPIAMWAQEAEVCSMECCMAEGHCCCAAAKPFVEGHDYSGVDEIGQPEFFSSCQNLATPPSGLKVFPRPAAPAVTQMLAAAERPQPHQFPEQNFYRSPQFSPDASRAPPVLLLNS